MDGRPEEGGRGGGRTGCRAGQRSVSHQAAVEPGSTPAGQGPLDSRGVPGTGAGVGAVPELTAHTRPSPRVKPRTPGAASSQRSVPSPNWVERGAQLEAVAVQVPEGAGVGEGAVGGVLGEPVGLRQPRLGASAPELKPNGGAVPGPGQRHPAAVAARARPPVRWKIGSGEHVVGQVDDLGQAQLLALVDVDRSGQRQHQQRGGAGPAGPGRGRPAACRLRGESSRVGCAVAGDGAVTSWL